ncbi:hypothetical protein GLW05_18470 [Pontibacillus yanchengensis]|uniref:Uncharacterized protein n=1 Tax=Pontibacillus yanchengensis TaxID=462910 RepID=A0A6I5A5C7_9BACI|nr:hypothetical protein [Pontibacillus yanchengensis]MYL35565.1 hypothetical protein [Pontibacillus yanchengensis]
MEQSFWRVVLSYGHVGYRNEISVARHLEFSKYATASDVLHEVNNMPGTKNKCVCSLYTISPLEYRDGKQSELENFYLQDLFVNKEAEEIC